MTRTRSSCSAARSPTGSAPPMALSSQSPLGPYMVVTAAVFTTVGARARVGSVRISTLQSFSVGDQCVWLLNRMTFGFWSSRAAKRSSSWPKSFS